MKILLLRTWITNIGNGFIDKGAKTILEQAFPNAELVESSGYPYLLSSRRNHGFLPNFFLKNKEPTSSFESTVSGTVPNQMESVGKLVDADVAVLPGCVLYPHVLERYKPIFRYLEENQIPLLLLGAGGGNYEPDTKEWVRDFLSETRIAGLMTRDSDAFEAYQSEVTQSYDGIDCAFFIDDWYEPPESDVEIDVWTFDKVNEPDISTSRKIVRANHEPFGKPYDDIWQQIRHYRSQLPFFEQETIFMSDSLRDYLFLYANSGQTHSDRIHACIPTLAYGNEAQFWYDTPRDALFEKVLDEDITEQPVRIDRVMLDSKKQEQVNALQEIITNKFEQPIS